MSEATKTDVGTFAEALGKAQAEFEAVKKDKIADAGQYKYKYADLSSVIDVAKKVLHKHGLAFTQVPKFTESGMFVLETSVMHISGYGMQGFWPLPEKARPQELGSALTYAKRYSLSSMLGIAAEEDDDAQAGNETKSPIKTKEAAKAEIARIGAGKAEVTAKESWPLYWPDQTVSAPYASRSAYLDAFEFGYKQFGSEDRLSMYEKNEQLLARVQADAANLKSKKGDEIVARIKAIHDDVTAISDGKPQIIP